MLSRIRVLTTYCASVIYTSSIRPVLDLFIATLSGTVVEQNSSSLEVLQRHAARNFCRMNYNSDKAVASLRWSSLQCRCDDNVLTLRGKALLKSFQELFYLSQDRM